MKLPPSGNVPSAHERLLLREQFAAAITEVVALERQVSRVQAEQLACIERARLASLSMGVRDQSTGGPGWSPAVVAERIVVTELAAAVHLSETDARRRLDTAEALAGPLSATREALQSGDISYRHAEKIAHHAAGLRPDRLHDYESLVLTAAKRVSVQRLGSVARAAVEEAQPMTDVERHLRAAAERRVTIDAATDGMAYLTHYLPAVEAVAIYNRATELARSLKNGGDLRTMAHLRVDTLSDLMLNGETSIPGCTTGIRPHVRVTVPVLTLLGHDGGGAAQLEGYGPIDRLTALRLARSAPSFRRVLTDPITGVVLNFGRERYRPPADLDELIRLTHTECAFPTCGIPSAAAELDHTRPWSEGGETNFANLGPLCSSHHKVKHHTEWKVEHDPAPPGSLLWTSPVGFAYLVEPTPVAPRSAVRHGPTR
ncbi:HNH endonuclease signature motif containing protein [Subtercola lobariae]|uniref:HNH nuclease domain-containing protein n=1 Tax=Subtercola lobariae TaxID=1588641 RepID=A0A917B6N8_9MICO|nr:HNH endonuclease signature motif containing protein [Subtercola lobariae]GGF25895.1 hypothetical protein GCM10011399_19180 [Subtercola lobariae]